VVGKALLMNGMSPEKEQEVFRRWPDWFRTAGDIRLSGMSDGFRCGDGWYDIIYQLFERLEPLVVKLDESRSLFEVTQVKQKFGELRFHANRRNDGIEAAINSAREPAVERARYVGTLAVWRNTATDCGRLCVLPAENRPNCGSRSVNTSSQNICQPLRR
jgi:hypothetical protein